MVMPYHLHMPSYFLETFTEYPYTVIITIVHSIKIKKLPESFSFRQSLFILNIEF